MMYLVLLCLILCGQLLLVSSELNEALEGLLKSYVDKFNSRDEEIYKEDISNKDAFEFLRARVPYFACPDKDLEEIYYFRWWTYRKHLRTIPVKTGLITVVTEFMPSVLWAGKGNSISAGAGHHIMEGRWIRGNDTIMDDYSLFWLLYGGDPRRYSFWIASSFWSRFLVNGNVSLIKTALPGLVQNYKYWEKMRLDVTNGLFWQKDDWDGMEVSIGGMRHIKGYRPTINSYQYGDAVAISRIAKLTGDHALAKLYKDKAAALRRRVESVLWDSDASFFKVLPKPSTKRDNATVPLVDVRELHGFTPWYFNLPSINKSVAWQQFVDPQGFKAKFGLTSAEQRHPKFQLVYSDHECQWNGPSWPFATSVTMTAMANLLNNYRQRYVTRQDYFDAMKTYASAQHRRIDNSSEVVPWIDENLHPYTGDWISRSRLKVWKDNTWFAGKGGKERGKDYNHSTFCDLVINGLIGLRPRVKNIVDVNPLIPADAWSYFILHQVEYHGHYLTIIWDSTGDKFNKGKGFSIFVNGILKARSDTLKRLKCLLD